MTLKEMNFKRKQEDKKNYEKKMKHDMEMEKIHMISSQSMIR